MKEFEEKISVIVPVYNTAEYISRCLDSILNSTYSNLEVICLDDGSSDNSGAILDEYREKDSRVLVIHTENHGISIARNTALSYATGNCIAFIDSDDWIHPLYFERLYFTIQSAQADIAVCSYINVSSVIEDREFLKGPEFSVLNVEQALQIENLKRAVWCKLYRKELLDGIEFVPGVSWGEDTLFNLQFLCSQNALRISYFPDPLYYYYQRPGSAVRIVKPQAKIKLISWYLDHLYPDMPALQGRLFLKESIKLMLSFRYEEMVKKTWVPYHAQFRSLYNIAKRYMRQSEFLTASDRIILGIFLASPHLYRMFRIHNDKTMLDWEKSIHEQQKSSH